MAVRLLGSSIGDKLRRAARGAAFRPTVVGSAPAITFGTQYAANPDDGYLNFGSAGSSHQITGGVQTTARSSVFTYFGGTVTNYGNTGVQLQSSWNGSAWAIYSQGFEFVFEGPEDGKLEVCHSCNGQAIDLWISDDGFTWAPAYTPGSKSAGTGSFNFQTMLVNFGGAVARKYLRVESKEGQLFGIGTRPENTLYPMPQQDTVKALFLGDSWTGPGSTATWPGLGWSRIMAKEMGWRNDWHIGTGGRGYDVTGVSSSVDIIGAAATELYPFIPSADVLVIEAATNDDQASRPAANVGAKVATLLAASRALKSNMPIIVMGVNSRPTFPTAINAAIQAAAVAQGVADGGLTQFIDTTGWIPNLGTTGSPTNDGNGDYYWGTSGHPNDAGHLYWGRRAAAAAKSLLPLF